MKTNPIFFFLFLLSSCVGTIQDAAQKIDDSSKLKKAVILFEGISKAKATAHTKMRLSFRPALGGSGTFSYNIYQNGGRHPISAVSLNSDNIDGDGFLMSLLCLRLRKINPFFY